MKIIVNPHSIALDKTPVNELELNVTKCEFEFAEEITDDYVKEAYFTLDNGDTYKQIIINNECDIPGEVLEKKGGIELGVVAYLVENETEIKRYNPSPAYFDTWVGSLRDAENSEPITPTDKEQIEQMLTNINITADKEGRITTITITNKDGVTQEVTLEDGKNIEYNWQGTQLGIRQEGESQYQYVDLKGEKGDAGAIKMQIVAELPQTGSDDTIYLVPLEHPDIQGNNYAEYVWVNNAWELLGKIGVQVDLTDYVKNTDYATSSKGGVVKISTTNGVEVGSSGNLLGHGFTYIDYQNAPAYSLVAKSTLENVITGKDLTTKTYVDGLVGDINTALDTINGEVI